MSAILDRKAQTRSRHLNSGICLVETKACTFHPRTFRTQPELERLRATLVEYDPHDHVTDFANTSPEYGAVIAKFVVYGLLAAVPAVGAIVFLSALSMGC